MTLQRQAKDQKMYDESVRRAKVCTLSKAGRKQFDLRCRKLATDGRTGIPTTMAPFKTIPRHRHQKTVAWIKMLRYHVPYLLYGVGDKKIRNALLKLTGALRDILGATCDYDPDEPALNEEQAKSCRLLKKKVVDALVEVERCLPASELSIFLHEIVHVPDFIYKWNNVRNFWCFVTERFVGYIKGFVKNRHLVLENLVSPHTQIEHYLNTA
jgi:hypothetical protein